MLGISWHMGSIRLLLLLPSMERDERVWEEPMRDLSKPRALLGHNSQEAVSLCHPQQRLSRRNSPCVFLIAWRGGLGRCVIQVLRAWG